MKLKITFLALLLCAQTFLAQSLLDSIQQKITHKLQHLNKNNRPTGILYDAIVPKVNMPMLAEDTPPLGLGFRAVGGTTTPQANTVSALHYFLALDDLQRADYLQRYNNAQSLHNQNATNQSYITIGLINADVDTFEKNPVTTGALYLNPIDSLYYENPSPLIPLYKTYRNSFLATPLKNEHTSKTVTYKLTNAFWKETAQTLISNLQINFGDGQGFRTVQKNQTLTINYATYGTKTLQIKAQMGPFVQRNIQATIRLIDAPNLVAKQEPITKNNASCYMPTSGSFFSNNTFQGYAENQAYAGRGRYVNHSYTTCITKPVVVIEGYDPNDNFNNDYTFRTLLDVNGLGNDLRFQENHDVFTLNFTNYTAPDGKIIKGGQDYIERNAMVLVTLLQRINANKSPNASPTKIIGFSKGGLVARYALRYMELNNIPHEADLMATVDTPHQGAIVPYGVQQVVDFVDDLVPSWIDNELNNLDDNLLNPSTQQMLVHHFQPNSDAPIGFPGFSNTFYNTLNTMGYPQQTRNIAVTNGRTDGVGTNSFGQQYYNGKVSGYFVFRGNWRLNFPTNVGKSRVFLWRFSFLGIPIWWRSKHVINNATIGSYETAPGGIATVDDLDSRILNFTKTEFDIFIAGMKQNLSSDSFSFISTKSALDYQGNKYLYQDISDANLVCTNNTPFDSYYTPNVNERHTYLSSGASQFLLDEIKGNPRQSSFVVKNSDLKESNQGGTNPCPNNNNWKRFYFDTCKVKQGTTWSVSNPNIITILSQNATEFKYKAKPDQSDTITITANIPNQDPISRTVIVGTDYNFPTGSNYQLAGTNNFGLPLQEGINNLPANNGVPALPEGVLATKKLPDDWQLISWQLDSDTQNAVYSWTYNSYSKVLDFNYYSHKIGAMIIFKLNAIDNCGLNRTLYVWFKVTNDTASRIVLNNKLDVNVFPNPAKTYINLDIKNKQEDRIIELKLYDFRGNIVLDQSLKSSKEQIRVDYLPRGKYILILKNGAEEFSRQVIIER